MIVTVLLIGYRSKFKLGVVVTSINDLHQGLGSGAEKIVEERSCCTGFETHCIVRQIGRQQGENVYFRTCYALFKHLQDKAEQASEDLLHLHQSGAFGFSDDEFYLVYQVAQELQISVHDLADQALKAQLACEEFCELDPSYSAREAFKFTDTVQTAGKSEADASQGVCDSPRSMQFIMLPVNDL